MDPDVGRISTGVHREGTPVEIEHVNAHHSTEEHQQKSLFEHLTLRAMRSQTSWQKDGATMDGGEMAQSRASAVQQRREEVDAALQCAVSFHCLVEKGKTVKKSSRTQKRSAHQWTEKGGSEKHIEWTGVPPQAKYRCMRCLRSSRHVEDTRRV